MKSILLASNFFIVGYILHNLCEIVSRSGKKLKFLENKTVEDYLETTHVKVFQNFTGSLSQKTLVMYTSSKNLPSWFDNDDFHSYHPGEVVETLFSTS